jgi:hypothetical protein
MPATALGPRVMFVLTMKQSDKVLLVISRIIRKTGE